MTSRLAALCLEADKAATPGPWKLRKKDFKSWSVDYEPGGCVAASVGNLDAEHPTLFIVAEEDTPEVAANEALICLYRTACPELAAEVIRLREALEASFEVMSGNAMHKSALVDALKLARAALMHEGSDR